MGQQRLQRRFQRRFQRLVRPILALALNGIFFLYGHCAFSDGYYNGLLVPRYPKLGISTAPQTIYASNCSGVLKVVTKNSAGTTASVGQALTVNLTATPGVTFYSDSGCGSAITSTTIAAGTSSVSIWFTYTSTGSVTVTATATNFASVSQNETVTTNPFVWTGGGADANWTTNANWSGGTAPLTTAQAAVFDGTCVSNCSPTINTNLTIGTIRLNSPYAGTITQGSGYTIYIAANYTQFSGSFVGGNSSIGNNGSFVISGGSFTNTSNALLFVGNFIVQNTPTLNFSLGTLVAQGVSHTITPGTTTYANVNFADAGSGTIAAVNGTMNVTNLTLSGTGTQLRMQSSGTIVVTGNITASNNGYNGTGYATVTNIELIGNPGGSTISGVSGAVIPSLTIAAGTNPVTFSGTVQVGTYYTMTSAGTFTTTGSTLVLGGDADFTTTLNPGSVTYNNVTLTPSWNTSFGGGTLNVGGNLVIAPTVATVLNNGTINVAGNLTETGFATTGTANIVLNGTSGSTISTNSLGLCGTSLTINESGQTVTLGSALSYAGGAQAVHLTAGSMNMEGYAMTVKALTLGGNTLTKAGGTLTVNGVVQGTGSLDGGTVNP